ncbi:MAG: asparagine synthase-related protein [Anaerolineae bacterium]
MSGIAGIVGVTDPQVVRGMLGRLAHRGPAGRAIVESDAGTLGVAWTAQQAHTSDSPWQAQSVQDVAADGHLARATLTHDGVLLARDAVGIAPLYYGRTAAGALCFSSEVKALVGLAKEVRELPPGHRYDGQRLEPYRPASDPAPEPELTADSRAIARELHRLLDAGVAECIPEHGVTGSWLSGGLDSSAMAALAKRHTRELHTFSVGLAGSPDIHFAREVAAFLGTVHHELLVTLDDLLAVLPDVIYHLESFDALLVRSSVTNYLVARLAAEHVESVFSGEGGDELFAGYRYLKDLPEEQLADELADITGRLHNTALQRVDRTAAAHGLLAHVVFLQPDVRSYAPRIPVDLKLRNGVEKWILREAMAGQLPESVLNREKAKFWEGAGIGDLLAQHAQERISQEEFAAERVLPNGWTLNSREELMYYRIFREHFSMVDLSWMGRTKGAPRE